MIVKLIFLKAKTGLIFLFSYLIENQLYWKSSRTLCNRVLRYVYCRLTNESFGIDSDAPYLSRCFDETILLKVHRNSVLERVISVEKKFYLSDFADTFIKSGEVCLDVGSNIGIFTLPLAKKHSNTSFYCMEPHPEIFQLLNQELAINNLNNVFPHNIAISNSDYTASFYANDINSVDNWGLSSFEQVDQSVLINVPCTSCDQFKKLNFPQKRVCFIKIDVQGFEMDVLLGAKEILIADRPVVVFEHEDGLLVDSEKTKIKIKEFLTEVVDYEVYILSKHLRNLYFPVDWDSFLEVDLIAIPKSL